MQTIVEVLPPQSPPPNFGPVFGADKDGEDVTGVLLAAVVYVLASIAFAGMHDSKGEF
jgi:hypothetical protein